MLENTGRDENVYNVLDHLGKPGVIFYNDTINAVLKALCNLRKLHDSRNGIYTKKDVLEHIQKHVVSSTIVTTVTYHTQDCSETSI